jgi:hypothetical protein
MSYEGSTGATALKPGEDKAGSSLAVEAELARTRESLAALRHLASLVVNRATTLFQAVASADPAAVDVRTVDLVLTIIAPFGLAFDGAAGVALKAIGQPDPAPDGGAPAKTTST